jgi:hypothetical protein
MIEGIIDSWITFLFNTSIESRLQSHDSHMYVQQLLPSWSDEHGSFSKRKFLVVEGVIVAVVVVVVVTFS